MSKDDELVLCCEAADLVLLDNPKGFVYTDFVKVNKFLRKAKLSFITRGVCETNESWKQIIPYCYFRHVSANDHFFAYQRGPKGNEDRLKAKWSVGVGGHINPIDQSGKTSVFWEALDRELREETTVSKYISTAKGVLYDDADEVGRVHLGIIVEVMALDKDLASREESITNTGFFPLKEIATKSLEGWSRLVVDKLSLTE